MRRGAEQLDRETVRGLRIERKQQWLDEGLVRSAAALHFSLTPGFSRVPAQPQARSRLKGFCSLDLLITGLKSGVNERIRFPHSFICSTCALAVTCRYKTG